jgi:hypothetical protein
MRVRIEGSKKKERLKKQRKKTTLRRGTKVK